MNKRQPLNPLPDEPAERTSATPILYPRLSVCGIPIPEEKTIITMDDAKNLLNWTEETEVDKFKDDYLLIDIFKRKVRCLFNTRNRPFSYSWSLSIAQDILRRQWQLNCETIIVGKYGQILSGQHRLVALVLANQLWERDNDYWIKLWPKAPTIRSLVAYGCDEDPTVTRTHDNVKPRTLSDVLFCDGTVFGKVNNAQRVRLCKMVENAIKFLWERTGERDNPWSHWRTHSEGLDYLSRHPKILSAVKHVHEEDQGGKDGKGKLAQFIGLGTAAGLLYLMGCCKSDGFAYSASDPRTEDSLDWSMWQKAMDYWTLLAAGEGSLLEVRHAIARLYGADGEEKASVSERLAILIKGWNEWAHGGVVNKETLKLRYVTDEEGYSRLKESPTLGGIDYIRLEREPSAMNPIVPTEVQPTLAEVGARKRLVDEERAKKLEEIKRKLEENREKAKAKRKADKEARAANDQAAAARTSSDSPPEVQSASSAESPAESPPKKPIAHKPK